MVKYSGAVSETWTGGSGGDHGNFAPNSVDSGLVRGLVRRTFLEKKCLKAALYQQNIPNGYRPLNYARFFLLFRNQLKKSLDDGVVKCHGTILSQRRGLGLGGADQGPCHIYTRTTELDYSGYVGRRRRPHGDLVLGLQLLGV